MNRRLLPAVTRALARVGLEIVRDPTIDLCTWKQRKQRNRRMTQ